MYYLTTCVMSRDFGVCSERLVESLRLPQVPILHAQVFLFFRVLLLRMSPQHLTSLWPTMITELVRNADSLFPLELTYCILFLSSRLTLTIHYTHSVTHSTPVSLQVQVFLLMEQELTADEDISRYIRDPN